MYPITNAVIHLDSSAHRGRWSQSGWRLEREPFTFTADLESAVDLMCMSLGSGRKLENQEGTHAGTWRTCKLLPGQWI